MLVSAKADNKTVAAILNKCDIAKPQKYLEFVKEKGIENAVCISAKNKDGLEGLEELVNKLYPDACEVEGGLILTNARQHAALMGAVENIDRALSALEMLTPDTACLDMEAALGELLEADGRGVSEEIVNNIFAHFCVGK